MFIFDADERELAMIMESLLCFTCCLLTSLLRSAQDLFHMRTVLRKGVLSDRLTALTHEILGNSMSVIGTTS